MGEALFGELTKLEDVTNKEITKAGEVGWSDWIRALDRLKKISEAMVPVEANFCKAKEDVKAWHSSGGSDDYPMQALDATITSCSCQIDSAVGKEWARAMMCGDCVGLLKGLKRNPCLLATSAEEVAYYFKGNTVLHWAATRRCLKLLVYILSLFLDDGGKVVKEFVHGVTKIDREEYFQKVNGVQQTAADLLWSVREYSIYAYFSKFAEPREFNLTLKEMQLELLDPMYVPPTSASSTSSPTRELVLKVTKEHKMLLQNSPLLKNEMEYPEMSYNFMTDYDELLFHYACEDTYSEECKKYVRAVIRGVVKEGPEVVKYLFNYRNAQGQTPLHCAIEAWGLRSLLKLLEGELPAGEEYRDCYNARNIKGWTPFHYLASLGESDDVEDLLKERRVSVNARLGRDALKATALHLAIIHDHLAVVRVLLEHEEIDTNAQLNKGIIHMATNAYADGTPLNVAVMMGRSDIVKALIDHFKGGELKRRLRERELSAIHIAGITGDPKTLRCFLNNPNVDISVTCRGWTTLHFVVDGNPLFKVFHEEYMREFSWDEMEYGKYKSKADTQDSLCDSDREACISMLIQAGLDVWQKNDEGNFPEPGRNVSSKLRYFWHQKLLTETQNAKNNLNVAGNAISVVSALVATASYVGPLQPPLGLDSNSVHDGTLAIRVYMVANTLSFYMAIASIIFAVVPSLPMPQEGLYEEWQRSRKTIIVAIHLLLLAVVNILVSFAAASNVVVSSEYSWQHQGLVFYPTLLGGLLCVIAISLFYLRLFRLTFVKNLKIKHIYQCVFRASQK